MTRTARLHKADIDWIGSKEYAREVAGFRERFLGDYEIRQTPIRDIVFESWLRCKKGGVDPQKRAAPRVARNDHVIGTVSNNRLRTVLQASLAAVAPYLNGERSVLIGTGAKGHIFFLDGDPHLSEALAENSVVEGSLWGETQIGTNAIGTALAVGGKARIHGEEHFCTAGKQWSCAAEVIRDPVDRTILGVVDMTGRADAISLHAEALVSTLVARIESELSRLELLDEIALIDRFHEMGHFNDGLLIVDRRGRVIRRTSHSKFAEAKIQQGDYLAGLRVLACDNWTLDLVPNSLRHGEMEWLKSDDEIIGAAIHVPNRVARSIVPVDLPPPLKSLSDSLPSQKDTITSAAILAKREVPILITGETGTGKDVLAKAIHLSGPRAKKALVSVNCAAIPRDLIGVELFGYVEGAFTGTRRGGMPGRIEEADGGTIFLDEIGDMPIELQPYLLRVLEGGTVSRLGESKQRRIDVRIIAATNQPLVELMEQKRFRSDLYYRLTGARLHLPPLRERRTDIPHIVKRIQEQICTPDDARQLDDAFVETLMRRDLPGNIRELKAYVERFVAGLPDDEWDIPPNQEKKNRSESLADMERNMILAAVERHSGNVRSAAAELSIPRSTLYRKLAQYRERDRD